jgi:hypothetical protein
LRHAPARHDARASDEHVMRHDVFPEVTRIEGQRSSMVPSVEAMNDLRLPRRGIANYSKMGNPSF